MEDELTKSFSLRAWFVEEWAAAKVNLFAGVLVCASVVFMAVLAMPIWVALFWEQSSSLMQVYLVGVVSYWLVWILCIFRNLLCMASTADRNLAQIGMKRNIFTGAFEPKGARSFGEKLMYGAFGYFLSSLLSWFVYLVEIYSFIKRTIAKWNRPKELKRIDWVMKNHLLEPFDMVRFDIQMSQIVLGRNLTTEEYAEYQRDLIDRKIDVKIADVVAANKEQPLLEPS